MGAERESNADATERVHVRRLDAVDTLRWSWDALRDHLELAGFAFAVNLLAVVTEFGISQPTPEAVPEFAAWVWPLSLVQLVALTVLVGVIYLTAADAVAGWETPLGGLTKAAAKRVPALVGTTLLAIAIVLVGLALLVLPGIYVFLRLQLAFPACVIDGLGPVKSLRTGWRDAGGNLWTILGVNVAYFAAVLGSEYVAGLLPGLAASLAGSAFSAVLFPLFGLAIAHVYLQNSRNR